MKGYCFIMVTIMLLIGKGFFIVTRFFAHVSYVDNLTIQLFPILKSEHHTCVSMS